MTKDPTLSKFDQIAASGEAPLDASIDKRSALIEDLQEQIQQLKDSKREDRFVFITVAILLLNVVFFSVMPTFGGPLALVILELIILVPLARKLGMEEIVQIISRTLDRISAKDNGEA